jgi:hypothetical protein
MAKNTKPRNRGTENKPYIEAMRGLRASSAAGTHDNRPRRQRTRASAKHSAIRDAS